MYGGLFNLSYIYGHLSYPKFFSNTNNATVNILTLTSQILSILYSDAVASVETNRQLEVKNRCCIKYKAASCKAVSCNWLTETESGLIKSCIWVSNVLFFTVMRQLCSHKEYVLSHNIPVDTQSSVFNVVTKLPVELDLPCNFEILVRRTEMVRVLCS